MQYFADQMLGIQRKRRGRKEREARSQRAPGFSAALGQTLRHSSDRWSRDSPAGAAPEGSSNSSRGDDFEVLPVPLGAPPVPRARRGSPVSFHHNSHPKAPDLVILKFVDLRLATARRSSVKHVASTGNGTWIIGTYVK